MLSDYHTAEDAFQATFLVLARRAGVASRQKNLAKWLYGVAFRVGKEFRRSEARRRAREGAFRNNRQGVIASNDETLQLEMRWVLDEELNRLPGRYRAAIVACELEGKSRREAARQLGLPEGTLSSDLARGRRLLRERLERRGYGAEVWGTRGLAREIAVRAVPEVLTESSARKAMSVLSGNFSAVPPRLVKVMNVMIRTSLVNKWITVAGVGASIAVVAFVGIEAQSGHAQPPRSFSPPNATDERKPRVASSIDGDQLRMKIEVPLDLIVPDTLILRGQGRQVKIAVGPRLIRQMAGHTGAVNAVAFSPDGKRVLSGSGWPWGDRTLRLWDLSSGLEIRRFPAAADDTGPATLVPGSSRRGALRRVHA